jgi:hypothetical protein
MDLKSPQARQAEVRERVEENTTQGRLMAQFDNLSLSQTFYGAPHIARGRRVFGD